MKLMRTPKTIDIDITNRCNLRCIYCSHFTSAGDVNQDLPKEEWIKFFEELNRCAVISVNISGGEPLVRKDLKDIIEGVVSNKMRFSITSNGTLITDEMAEFLSSTRRCDFVQVSIDGSIPIVHDMFRGEGNFQKAINGIKILQKYNVPTTVRVTIHKQNVRDLENIAKFLLEDIGLPSFSTNSASYMGLCRQNSELVQLTVEERSIAMEKLLELSKKYGNRISASAGPLSEGRTWVKIEHDRREGKKGKKGFLTGCGGPFTKLAIRADGVIVPCNQLSHIELGRINQDSIEDIWQNHPEMIKLRERCNIPLSRFEFCQGCDYMEFCTGNCPALSYNLVGEVDHPSPDACLRRFLEEGGKLPDENLLIGIQNG